MISGIDISRYQSLPDWEQVPREIEFVIVSGGDGRGTNPLQAEQVAGAVASRRHVESYHFLRFYLTPTEMADYCRWTHGEAIKAGAPGDHRLWLDEEDVEYAGWIPSPAEKAEWLLEVVNRLSDLPLGLYTGCWWWSYYMVGFEEILVHLPLWIASYGSLPPPSCGWVDWLVWQYTSEGQVPGIVGNVDMNRAKDGYLEDEMSAEDRARLARLERLLANNGWLDAAGNVVVSESNVEKLDGDGTLGNGSSLVLFQQLMLKASKQATSWKSFKRILAEMGL